MRRQPFGHGIGIEKRAINLLPLGAENAVKANGVGGWGGHGFMVIPNESFAAG
jgi:hypothetical protein